MNLKSNAFAHNQEIPTQYSCQGQGISPALEITNPPDATASFVLILDDPDAPNKTFVHWVVWNINPKTRNISMNSQPGVAGTNSASQQGYFPPCPPSGKHRYIFTVYALDSMLNLHSDAKKDDVLAAMQGHILESAQLIGLYQKN